MVISLLRMTNYQNDMRRLVETFVSQLSEMWRRQAIDTLTGIGGGGGGSSSSSGGSSRRSSNNSNNNSGGGNGGGSSSSSSSSGGSVGRPRGRGAKRTAEEIEEMAERFVEFVQANPGLRIEQINKQLGTTTKDLALPIRKLISDGAVKVKGSKRATTYTASEGGRRKKNK